MEIKIGEVCSKHPELGGQRFGYHGPCVECKRKRDRDNIRLRRKHDLEFREVEKQRHKEKMVSDPKYRAVRLAIAKRCRDKKKALKATQG